MRGARRAAHHAGARGIRGNHRLGAAADFAYRSAISDASRWHTAGGLHPARLLRLWECGITTDGVAAHACPATVRSGGLLAPKRPALKRSSGSAGTFGTA